MHLGVSASVDVSMVLMNTRTTSSDVSRHCLWKEVTFIHSLTIHG